MKGKPFIERLLIHGLYFQYHQDNFYLLDLNPYVGYQDWWKIHNGYWLESTVWLRQGYTCPSILIRGSLVRVTRWEKALKPAGTRSNTFSSTQKYLRRRIYLYLLIREYITSSVCSSGFEILSLRLTSQVAWFVEHFHGGVAFCYNHIEGALLVSRKIA